MIRPEGTADIGHLDDLVKALGVTHCQFVPTLLDALLAADVVRGWSTVRSIGVGGEALKPTTVCWSLALGLRQVAVPRDSLEVC